MRIIGHGIDIVNCKKIERLTQKHSERFLTRIFTRKELDYCLAKRRCWEHLAGRFAAKEAVMKVLGTGWRADIRWKEIEIVNALSGKPELVLKGNTQKIAKELGIERIIISISHTSEYAIASALGLADH